MRLVTVDSAPAPRAALLRDGRVYDIEGRNRGVRELLEGGLADGVKAVDGEGLPVDEVPLLAPIPRPGKIVCIGLNYSSHAREAGLDPPETPTFFAKYSNAVTHPGASVRLPPGSTKVDYEAEVAFVIGGRCKDVPEEHAMHHVAGYMLFNDLSARDLQFSTPQWMPGKVFDGSAPCGPALVTPDEAGAHDAIEIELTLNGEVMQRASTSDLIHSVPALVAHLSTLMTLEPGDVVATGTPSGVGGARDPSVWLKAGDEVVVRSPQLGELVTGIA